MPRQKTTGQNKIQAFLDRLERKPAWLARKVGRSRSQVSRYATNESQPDIFMLKKIADALGCRMDDLV